ncbi:hypothetical protein P154DRAFT_35033 [Amniculicola lignicola CBS 123094]|uniref:Uncharacterized protein n=1 Tax=Amniculicola lignicola CBS 123094 TaxID=1392246 RepID=A0A6A5WUH6_9PLEO|nr:hypothetical protein P154DRAFT_35033 [Amniculicola lignicola CBS 123094]
MITHMQGKAHRQCSVAHDQMVTSTNPAVLTESKVEVEFNFESESCPTVKPLHKKQVSTLHTSINHIISLTNAVVAGRKRVVILLASLSLALSTTVTLLRTLVASLQVAEVETARGHRTRGAGVKALVPVGLARTTVCTSGELGAGNAGTRGGGDEGDGADEES